MTYEELMARMKDVKLKNRYMPIEDTHPHCLLHRRPGHDMLGSEISSNVLGYSDPRIPLVLCYDYDTYPKYQKIEPRVTRDEDEGR